jgi:hypothetical protein
MGRVQASLAESEKRLSRIDREQFKARTLTEAQMEQFAAALDMLRTADARREAELEARRTQNEAVIIPRKRCSICCTSWRMRRANTDWPAEWHILWPDGS